MAPYDAASLAAQLEEASRALLQALSDHSAHTSIGTPWWGEGQSRDLDTLASIGLGEFLVHGYDIATALGQRWSIDPGHACLVLDGAI